MRDARGDLFGAGAGRGGDERWQFLGWDGSVEYFPLSNDRYLTSHTDDGRTSSTAGMRGRTAARTTGRIPATGAAKGVRLYRKQTRGQRGVEAACRRRASIGRGVSARQSVGQQAGADAQVCTVTLQMAGAAQERLSVLQDASVSSPVVRDGSSGGLEREKGRETGIRLDGQRGSTTYLMGKRGSLWPQEPDPASTRRAGLGCYAALRASPCGDVSSTGRL
ncbi:hypothetical protein BU23DRAFT_125793 [Bimuria novae-zelandiae CBS 107.79]|uniref:Uncharacterized protein n=1 Tax=Bimuria novae-zelandiae CBS 107.79 TaxID=1447943 RepID=A0A6A5VKE3_9PLEO|nr:hypothetical protein BU23DRAFT_125793 [Bimuria novae-zelandiae CBS 107.79]